MTVLAYTVTPRSRISAGRTGEVQEGKSIHRVLPGTAIRGALGHTWWLSPTHAFEPKASQRVRQDAFDRLFGRALVVRDAVPTSGAFLRTPSMAYLKYTGRGGQTLEGYHDLAVGPLVACPACSAPFAKPRGWLSVDGTGAGRPLDRCPACGAVFGMAKDGWHVPDEHEVAATRTALVDGVAEDEKLFTRTALRKQLRFRGTVVLRDAVTVPPEAVAWLEQQLQFNVGGQRSTLGRVDWTVEAWQPDPLPTTNHIVLQLRSPAILVDERGFPSLDLAGYLQRVPGAGALACRPWTRATQVSGWHALAGVPKSVEWALEAGSTAVLTGWSPDALRTIAGGIGLRQLEGYGEVALKSPADLARFGRPARERLLEVAESKPEREPVATVASTPPAPTPTASPTPTATPTPALTSTPRPAPAAAPQPPAPAPEAEPKPATAAPPAQDPRVAGLMASVPPTSRARVVNGVLGQARSIATKRELGMTGTMIDSVIALTLGYPWARDLGPDGRRLVQELLRSPDIRDVVTQLEAQRSKL